MNLKLRDVLEFKFMVTPYLIQLFFWLALIFTVISSIYGMFTGGFWSGLITLIIGPFIIRAACEIMIVLFEINENLFEIKEQKKTSAKKAKK